MIYHIELLAVHERDCVHLELNEPVSIVYDELRTASGELIATGRQEGRGVIRWYCPGSSVSHTVIHIWAE
jgi:hypothetical protein